MNFTDFLLKPEPPFVTLCDRRLREAVMKAATQRAEASLLIIFDCSRMQSMEETMREFALKLRFPTVTFNWDRFSDFLCDVGGEPERVCLAFDHPQYLFRKDHFGRKDFFEELHEMGLFFSRDETKPEETPDWVSRLHPYHSVFFVDRLTAVEIDAASVYRVRKIWKRPDGGADIVLPEIEHKPDPRDDTAEFWEKLNETRAQKGKPPIF